MESAEGVKSLGRNFISLKCLEWAKKWGKADVESTEDRWSEAAYDIWSCHGKYQIEMKVSASTSGPSVYLYNKRRTPA